MNNLRELLEPIAAWFRSFGSIPEPIVHWGHPLMMVMVVFVMGSFVEFAGWQSRIVADKEVAIENEIAHRTLAA